MQNPFIEITARLDALTVEVRKALNTRQDHKPLDELGGMDLAVEVTGLSPKTIYKKTMARSIPHTKKGGRLYFRRSELERWIDSGRRATAEEVATERMAGNK